MARYFMRNEKAGHSMQATELVHEAYARLVDYKRMRWHDRVHFYAVSAEVMRRILVDHARRHNVKRGKGMKRVVLDESAILHRGADPDLVALDDAMNSLAQMDPRKARVVELRFFGGLEVPEIAAILNISEVTVKRDWKAARLWLYRELNDGGSSGPATMETD